VAVARPGRQGAADNLEPTDFVVSLNIAGQIHGQIKDLPPGAEIQIQFGE
jgi:hypothetical protein